MELVAVAHESALGHPRCNLTRTESPHGYLIRNGAATDPTPEAVTVWFKIDPRDAMD
jgi:hypothetical protein